MDMFKKARSKVKATVKEVQALTGQQQSTQSQQQYYTSSQSQNHNGFPVQNTQVGYEAQTYSQQPPKPSPYPAYPYAVQQPQSYFPPTSQSNSSQNSHQASTEYDASSQAHFPSSVLQQATPLQSPYSNSPPMPPGHPYSQQAPPANQATIPPNHQYSVTPHPPPNDPFPQTQLAFRPPPPAPQTNSHTPPAPRIAQYLSSSQLPPQNIGHCTELVAELGDYVQFYQFSSQVVSSQSPLDPDYDFVCHYCYSTKISSFPNLASSFTPVQKKPWPADDPRPRMTYDRYACCFRLPTVQSIFYRSCIPQNSIQPLVKIIQYAKSMPVCSGEWLPSGQPFYATHRVQNFKICIPCFETNVRGTVLESQFRQKTESVGTTWACNVSLHPYIDRLLRIELKKSHPDAEKIMAEISARCNLTPCPGDDKVIAEVGSGKAFHYGPEETLAGVYCEACYFDVLKETPLEKELGHRYEITDEYKGVLTCEIASAFSKNAMITAVRSADANIWREVIVKQSQVTPCKGIWGTNENQTDILEGPFEEWFHFTDYPNVEVCPHCYWTTVKLYGASHLFSPIKRPLKEQVIRQCFFTAPPPEEQVADISNSHNFQFTLSWRGKMLRETLSYGYESRGDFTGFLYTAKQLSAIPPPCGHQLRGFTTLSGRKWFGRIAGNANDPNDCTIIMCEECNWDCVKEGTALHSHFSNDITAEVYRDNPGGFFCQTYSKLSKRLLTEACTTGDFGKFARHWHKRAEVKRRYDPWPALMKAQNEACAKYTRELNQHTEMAAIQGGTQLMTKLNAQTNAFIMGVGGSVSAAASDGGHQYGNSAIGWHGSSGSAQAAQAHLLAANLPNGSIPWSGGGANMVQIQERMLKEFNAISAEFLAVE